MRRRLAGNMLVFLFCSALMAVPSLSDERVELKALGVDLTLPDNWFQVPEEASKNLVPAGTALIATDDPDGQFLLQVRRDPQAGRKMEYAISSTIHYVYTEMEGFVDREEDFLVGSEPGYIIRYEPGVSSDLAEPRRFVRVVALYDGWLYTFQGVTDRKSFAKHEGAFESIVKGLSWRKNNGIESEL